MDIHDIKNRKKQLGLTNKQLADYSGVSLGTVNKILSGATKSPQIDTLDALDRVLQRKEFRYHTESEPVLCIREESIAYDTMKKDGEYTLEDYYALPEEVRAELIDGYLIHMDAPTIVHQEIIGELCYYMRDYVKKNEGECRVILSPIDVCLNKDNKTMLQPDLVVICDKELTDGRRINGAPDFVAEVVSPSSRKRDYMIKLNKYWKAGVREYWIIDPEKKDISTYWLQGSDTEFEVMHYDFEDKVPMRIWAGAEIDFSEFDILW